MYLLRLISCSSKLRSSSSPECNKLGDMVLSSCFCVKFYLSHVFLYIIRLHPSLEAFLLINIVLLHLKIEIQSNVLYMYHFICDKMNKKLWLSRHAVFFSLSTKYAQWQATIYNELGSMLSKNTVNQPGIRAGWRFLFWGPVAQTNESNTWRWETIWVL